MFSKINNNFYIYTLGCKLNQYESEAISSNLISSGYNPVKENKLASIIIINTCTVTSKADAKSRNIIRKIRKDNPDSLLLISGCMVDIKKSELLDVIEADIFVGNKNKDKIVNILKDYEKGLIKSFPYFYDSKIDGSFNLISNNFQKHSRAFLKIQDGCDNKCSYCIVPYARGDGRSRDYNSIINELENYKSNRFEEIVLTGINFASYKNEKYDFNDFLDLITDKYHDLRFRLSSIEPEFINNNLINILKKDNICPHFHIPLQSGTDNILKLMNRRYSINEYEDKINLIRSSKNNPFISTDLILGFPDESIDDFDNTYNFVNKMQFAHIHLFGFSPRKGTPAFDFKNKIPERIRDERIEKLKLLADKMNMQYRESYLNCSLEIIIEKKENNIYYGKSENYLDLKLTCESSLDIKKRYKVVFKKIINNENICNLL